MHLRVALREPGGGTVIRDVGDGLWADPWGTPDEVIDADLWALPGLIDAHAHLAGEAMLAPGDLDAAVHRATAALEAGVGLIVDKGWSDLTVIDLIGKVPVGERPEIEAAGVICSVEGGFWDGFARNVSPGGVGAAVARAADEGRGWVKLIGDWPRKGMGPLPNFTEEELAEAVSVARDHHARVAVHTMAREVPSMAVRAGVDSIEHGLFLSPDDLAALGERGGSWVPTVVQVEAVIRQLGAESSGGRLLIEGLDNVVANLARAIESGVHVLAGTDLALGTHQVALEAIRLWEMGMEASSVVDAVSAAGYRSTGREHGFDAGSPANAVLFGADPILDPRVLAHPSRVIRLGRVVR